MVLYNIFKLKADKYGTPFLYPSPDYNVIKNKLKEFETEFSRKEFLNVFPVELRPFAGRMVGLRDSARPDLSELIGNEWFSDNMVKGIYYLDNFYNLPENNKQIFLTSFAKIIGDYSADLIEKRVLPFIAANMVNTTLLYQLTVLLLAITEKKLVSPVDRRK